jgi:uncharacterized protein YaaN involved in tellurite resistance
MAKDIYNAIEGIYKISEAYEKAKQRAASLKGRKQEIRKRSEKEWGIGTIDELRTKQTEIKKELRKGEAEIVEMYNDLKKDF